MSDDLKTKVQEQFGAAAADYATSEVHAKGDSLAILLELVNPQPTWQVLDVATGAGHTALLLAPHVAQVTATDLTEAMVAQAAELAAARNLSNIKTQSADAESLPFDDNTFDLVTCRIAAHHFPNIRQAFAEFARVLKPGGLLGFTDNVTIPDKQAGGYYNAYEKLRDPSHNWVYPLLRLQSMLEAVGFTIEATRQFSKEMEFQQWADRMQVSPTNKEKLLEMMRRIPATLEPLFTPRWTEYTLYFSLREAVIVARIVGSK